MTQMFPKFSLVLINVLWYFLSSDTLFMKTKSGSVLLVRLNWTNFSKSLSCVPCGWLFWSTWFMFETILIVGLDFCRLEFGKQCWLLSPVVVRDRITTNDGASHTNDHVWPVKLYHIYGWAYYPSHNWKHLDVLITQDIIAADVLVLKHQAINGNNAKHQAINSHNAAWIPAVTLQLKNMATFFVKEPEV